MDIFTGMDFCGLKVTPEITGATLYSGPSSLLQAARQHAATAMISSFFIL